MRNTINSS